MIKPFGSGGYPQSELVAKINECVFAINNILHPGLFEDAPESTVTSTNKPMPVAPKPCATCGNCTALIPRCSLSVDVDDAPWIENECPDYKPRTASA